MFGEEPLIKGGLRERCGASHKHNLNVIDLPIINNNHQRLPLEVRMANTVILGSGIIGLSTAYYLSQHQPGSTIHLVDSSPELFASASGYAGGFIAKDWFQRSVSSLAELSFEEHRKLADAHRGGENWAYSRSVSVTYDRERQHPQRTQGEEEGTKSEKQELARDRARESKEDHIPKWLRRYEGDSLSIIDEGEGTAIL